jgi:hypothetical protein
MELKGTACGGWRAM